jgi:hypothetical protein
VGTLHQPGASPGCGILSDSVSNLRTPATFNHFFFKRW